MDTVLYNQENTYSNDQNKLQIFHNLYFLNFQD